MFIAAGKKSVFTGQFCIFKNKQTGKAEFYRGKKTFFILKKCISDRKMPFLPIFCNFL